MIETDTQSRADAVEIVYEPVGGSPRKTVYEPFSGEEATHERVEMVWNGVFWRRCGSELVELIELPMEAER